MESSFAEFMNRNWPVVLIGLFAAAAFCFWILGKLEENDAGQNSPRTKGGQRVR
ncbi:MAG: hypothetical protein V1907_03725 [Candidatus Kerfeldbacteria bacterium]